MIAKRLTVFMGPLMRLLNGRDGHPTAAPDLSRALQTSASTRHPEQAASFAASEGPQTGRVVAPDPKLPSCKATEFNR
jgi:hypothetical protein